MPKNKNHYTADELLNIYANDADILKTVKLASEYEDVLRNGIGLENDSLAVYGFINDDTGFWEIILEVDHGRIIYSALNEKATLIDVTSIPDSQYAKGDAQREFTTSMIVDLTDSESVKEFKETFKNDYILDNIQLSNKTKDKASRLAVWHLRAYRKFFLKHSKEYGFLWENTEFNSASALAEAMKEKGLMKEGELLCQQ